MTIVVDLGCRTDNRYPNDESLLTLLSAYGPRLLYGFDPHPDTDAGYRQINGTQVFVLRQAAWLFDGEIPFDPREDRPLAAAVGSGTMRVPCFDLAQWLSKIDRQTGERLVLKLDVEGAEYMLLARLLDTDTAVLVDELLVEWHGDRVAERDAILARWPGKVSEW